MPLLKKILIHSKIQLKKSQIDSIYTHKINYLFKYFNIFIIYVIYYLNSFYILNICIFNKIFYE